MRNLTKDLENRKINFNLLEEYGFKKDNNNYILKKNILNDEFKVIITITNNEVLSKLIDLSINEEYQLVDVINSSGQFVGSIRSEYENIIHDFIMNCSNYDVFKSKQSKEIIKYIKDKYNDDLEYLWKKFPKNAVWRNKENNKWYGALLTIEESKLGIKSDKIIEILDIRCSVKGIVDNEKYFQGYHMNKNNWITIKMDNTVSNEVIYKLIDDSYNISLIK